MLQLSDRSIVAGRDWLRFADADVVMDSSAIACGVRYAIDLNVDHLAVAPPGKPLLKQTGRLSILRTRAIVYTDSPRRWLLTHGTVHRPANGSRSEGPATMNITT
jgi:hypothetical protein